MTYTIEKPVYAKKGKKHIWLQPGVYKIVRWFDDKRIIIEIPGSVDTPRLITLVPVYYGLVNK